MVSFELVLILFLILSRGNTLCDATRIKRIRSRHLSHPRVGLGHSLPFSEKATSRKQATPVKSQFSDDTISNDDPKPVPTSMQHCYDTLNKTLGSKKHVTSRDYLEFLREISEGEMRHPRISDASLLFVLIFLTAACTSAHSCVAQDVSVSLDNQKQLSFEPQQFLCQQVLKHTYTRVDLSFEYTLVYNSSSPRKEIMTCLEGATERLLLEQLGNCSIDDSPTLNDRKLATKGVHKPEFDGRHERAVHAFLKEYSHLLVGSNITQVADQLTGNAFNATRLLEQSQNEDKVNHKSTCPYTIDAVVRGMTDIGT